MIYCLKVSGWDAGYMLKQLPSGSYTSGIAYNVKTAPTNIIGAIRGMESKCREDESLISLKIVERMDSQKDIKLCKLTDFGKEIIESIKK